MPASCLSGIFRAHSAYAKVGPTVNVAWKAVIASSHVTGRARNAIGGMRQVSAAQ
jgi:hypothetical protein